jgi:hypothetical protein
LVTRTDRGERRPEQAEVKRRERMGSPEVVGVARVEIEVVCDEAGRKR